MRKKRLSTGLWIPAIPVALVLGAMFFSPSCANTTQAPSGGKKDTIPPVIVGIKPLPGATGVPVHNARISFTFNEYVTVKEPKNIYLSPPQAKAPKYKVKGKSLVVYFEEDLLPNMTYTIDLTGAVVDNNESNPFPGYTTWFSTGDTADSMYVTGNVYDCNNLMPVKGATVMLYKDHADSAVMLSRPVAAVKTDDWGFFSIRNIKDTLYRAYAVVDANGNNIYDPDEDRIAFLDSLFKPVNVVSEDIPELKKYDMKDTLSCLARRSDVELNVFRERPSKQMLMNKVRLSDRASYITFMAPDTQIDSLWFRGFPADRVITEFNPRKDSLLLWLNVQRPMPDTLFLNVKYWKTDTLGVLKPETEEVSLVDENKPKSRSARKKISHADTICALTLKASPETFEQYGYSIEFKDPPILAFFDSLQFKSVNPPLCKIQQGWDYIFRIPERTFKDINGHWNDSTNVKITLPNDEDLSSLTLNIKGVDNKYIVDFQNESKSEIKRTYIIDSDCQLLFPYLAKGKYAIRITEDVNRNGIVDTGNLLKHIQPEKVRYFKIDDEDLIEIPERSEIIQDLDLRTMFK